MSDEAPVVKPPNRIVAVWKGEQEFDVSRPGGPAVRIDGHGKTGTGPVDTMLGALAACSAIDVVSILKKQRTPVSSLEVEVIGQRADRMHRFEKFAALAVGPGGQGFQARGDLVDSV